VGAAAVSVTVPVEGLPPVTVDGLTLTALRLAGAAVPEWTRTAIQSRKKSREVELATLITRTRKLASATFAVLHVRPHMSVALPSVKVVIVVPSVPVAFAAVHVVPPSHESCTHIFGEPDVLSARASSRTSTPVIDASPGIAKP
jgi:hypothetical protein